MNKKIIMGVDPKYNGFAYTVIEAYEEDGQLFCDYLDSGTLLNTKLSEHHEATQEILKRNGVTTLGIEMPGQYGKIGFEGAFLISSALQIGILISTVVHSGNLPIMLYPAQVNRKGVPGEGWRYYLVGRRLQKKRAAWDALVKTTLDTGIIWNFPNRSNKDVRDSAVIAYTLALAIYRKELDKLGCIKPSRYSDYIKNGRKK